MAITSNKHGGTESRIPAAGMDGMIAGPTERTQARTPTSPAPDAPAAADEEPQQGIIPETQDEDQDIETYEERHAAEEDEEEDEDEDDDDEDDEEEEEEDDDDDEDDEDDDEDKERARKRD